MGGVHHLLPAKVPYVDGYISLVLAVAGTRPILDLDALGGLFCLLKFLSRKLLHQRCFSHPSLAYQNQLDNGTVVKSSDIDATYQAMSEAFNNADDEEKWRNMFVGALVVTYGLNIVDIILSRPDTGEVKEPATSMEIQKDGFRVVRTFSF